MKVKQSMTATFALLLTLLFSACASVNAAPDKHRSEILEANEAFMIAFNNGDAAALAELYTEDASLMPTNSDFVNGKEAIASVWQSVFDAGIKQAKLETLEVEGLGGVLYEVGKYTLFVDGGAVADSGKYVVIWKMENGRWSVEVAS